MKLRVCWLAALLSWPLVAQAHPMAPAALTVREGAEGQAELSLRATPAAFPLLRWRVPEGCATRGAPRQQVEDDAITSAITLQCGALPSAARWQLTGLERTGIDAVVSVQRRDGTVDHALLSPATRAAGAGAAGADAGEAGVFERYLRLGFGHLWAGLDHILFVLCLLLLARTPRGAVWALSAFTVGHALTLTLSALGLVQLPQAWAESLIAASLVWMAGSVLLEGRGARHLGLACGGFGLVHGLGFAGVLREVGLPPGASTPALLAFNVGIELGQLALALVAWAMVWGLGRFLDSRRLDLASAYALASLTGVLGAFWVFERL